MAAERDPREPAVRFCCPVCGYRGLGQPAYRELSPPPFADLGEPPYDARYGSPSHQGCHGCGYEFGYDDDAGAGGTATSFRDYRRGWVAGGCGWWSSRPQPDDWSPATQMRAAGIDPDAAPDRG